MSEHTITLGRVELDENYELTRGFVHVQPPLANPEAILASALDLHKYTVSHAGTNDQETVYEVTTETSGYEHIDRRELAYAAKNIGRVINGGF